MNYLTFQQEKDVIVESLFNNLFGKIFQKENKDFLEKDIGLEVYITPECNQNCSYCYLCKHGEELYPTALRDEEKILKNLEILLNYCVEKQWNPGRFDLFSGEIWDTDFGKKVLSIVSNAIDNGFKPKLIVIPSNFSFILSDKALIWIEEFMDKCEKNSVRPCFSCSNDGLILDLEVRPLNSPDDYEHKKGTEEYYQKLFNFCKKWNLGFHPMVAAHGIEKWSENFLWWMSELEKYKFSRNSIMFLEVRNDDWTDEKIYYYLKYLNTHVNYSYDKYNALNENGFNDYIHRKNKLEQYNYDPIFIEKTGLHPGCTIHRSLVIRLGDLAIVPCHRTSYDEFIIGHLKVENEKITGVTAKNIQIMNQVWLNNMSGNAKCATCKYNHMCMKGCYGSQFESTGELLFPIESVCNLYKARVIFIYHKYLNMGLLNEKDDKKLFNLIESIKDTEEYKKWSEMSLKIIN